MTDKRTHKARYIKDKTVSTRKELKTVLYHKMRRYLLKVVFRAYLLLCKSYRSVIVR